MYENTERVERFRAEVADMRLRDPATGLDRMLGRVGAVCLVGGVGITAVAWFISHGTRNPLQQRDAIVLALLGVALAVVGGALWLKSALAGFLRFWMARLCYEQQAQADRIVSAVETPYQQGPYPPGPYPQGAYQQGPYHEEEPYPQAPAPGGTGVGAGVPPPPPAPAEPQTWGP